MECNLYSAEVTIKGRLTKHEILEFPDKFLLRKGGFTKGTETKRSWKLINSDIFVKDNTINYKGLVFTQSGKYEHPYSDTPRRNFEVSMDFKLGAKSKLELAGVPQPHKTKFSKIWRKMRDRCGVISGYLDVEISKNFSDEVYFISWCCLQNNSLSVDENLKTYELDKDILSPIKRIYSEYTCVFIPNEINAFFIQVRKILLNEFAGVQLVSGYKLKNGNQYYKISIRRKDGNCKLLHSENLDILSRAYREHYCTIAKSLAEKYKDLDPRVTDILTDLETYINKYKTW